MLFSCRASFSSFTLMYALQGQGRGDSARNSTEQGGGKAWQSPTGCPVTLLSLLCKVRGSAREVSGREAVMQIGRSFANYSSFVDQLYSKRRFSNNRDRDSPREQDKRRQKGRSIEKGKEMQRSVLLGESGVEGDGGWA